MTNEPTINAPREIACLDVNSWTHDVEDFIRDIEEKCIESSDKHMKAGYDKKKKHTILALPPIIIPAFMSPISGKFEDEEWLQVMTPITFAVVAVASGVATFFNFSKKSEQHFNYAARYHDIVTDIKEQLAKDSNNRLSASVFSATIKIRYDQLNISAPVL